MIRDIQIKPVLNGFVVTVGCQALVFESVTKLVSELEAYLKHPDELEKNYRSQSLNKWLLEERTPEARLGTLSQGSDRVSYVDPPVCGQPVQEERPTLRR